MLKIKFWGVRGSIPAPLTPEQVRAKVKEALRLSKEGLPIPFEVEATYGGNTTCVEVNAGDQLFILDMGTGVRELGKVQMNEVFATKMLRGTVLQSHVHHDHIQGFPFWAPLYLPRRIYDCKFKFFGGKQWDSQLNIVYKGQMNPPVFPVNLEELEHTAMDMTFQSIWDGWSQDFLSDDAGRSSLINAMLGDPAVPFEESAEPVKVLARKLFHPQETFGYRISYGGKSFAFTTDHEPYAGGMVPKALAELVQGVDIWATDCQYDLHEYAGTSGPQKLGWGHSYPEYIAQVAREAKPKKIITTHHDPDSNDFRVLELARQVQELSQIETIPAYEGLEVVV